MLPWHFVQPLLRPRVKPLPRISNGTNSPRLALLYRRNIMRVWTYYLNPHMTQLVTYTIQLYDICKLVNFPVIPGPFLWFVVYTQVVFCDHVLLAVLLVFFVPSRSCFTLKHMFVSHILHLSQLAHIAV